MNKLLAKLKKSSTIEDTDLIMESKFFEKKDMIPVIVPMINVALSGDLDGGMVPGLTLWCGPSKHFKTLFSMIMAKAYMDYYPEAILLFYNSEFGTPISYFDSLEIDKDRVLMSPIVNIEKLKFDIVTQLEELDRDDKVFILIDSIGNLASKKELDDALEGKSVADMTRAKQLKSLFRMVTPYLVMKDIPLVAVNHTYKEQALYPKDIVSGGTGPYYSADNIFIIGRQQEKATAGANKGKLTGYNFVINVEKSRYVKEKSKIPISVSFDGGIDKYSGLLEVAIEGKFVVKGAPGKYHKIDLDTGEIAEKAWKEDDTSSPEFWAGILDNNSFKQYIKNTYQLGENSLITGV